MVGVCVRSARVCLVGVLVVPLSRATPLAGTSGNEPNEWGISLLSREAITDQRTQSMGNDGGMERGWKRSGKRRKDQFDLFLQPHNE